MLYANFHIVYNEKHSFQYEFSAEEGDVCLITAPSGKGKTSMFKALTGLQEISKGSIKFGSDIWNKGKGLGLKPQQRNVSMAFQQPAFIDSFSVLKNITLFNPAIEKDKLEKALEIMGLFDYQKQKVAVLSGGQKKRLEFLKAVLSNKQLVLLDEPFNGSEPKMIKKMVELIQLEVANSNKIFIINSHINFELPVLKCFEMINGCLLRVEKGKEVLDAI